MQDERDYLISKVFPSLRRYCEERAVSIFELDLRWGISEEEAKQGKVFEICLKEVIKTKPFFIGLLGERYGWIPAEEERKAMAQNTSIFEEFPWVMEKLLEGTSITEIEILEGVLRSQEKMNAYFYVRSQKIKTPDEFIEKKDSLEEQKLLKLKETLKKQELYPVKEYDSIEHLGLLVEEDFKILVDTLFPETTISWLEKERLQQKVFYKNKTSVYTPDTELLAKLDEFISSEKNAIVITGESGMGKSAFLANWIKRRFEQQIENEKIIYHFIGVSQSEGDHNKIIKRLIEEVQDIYMLPITKKEKISDKPKKPEEIFQSTLYSLAENEKLIIIFDGIDRLIDTDNAKLLNWILPYPRNIKLIFSTLPNDKSMDVFTRRTYENIKLKELPQEIREQITINYLKVFSKRLTASQIKRISSDIKTENPLILLTLLDELRVFGIHEKLDERIDYYLSAADNEGLFEQVLQRIEEVYADTQKNLVKDILSLITASRHGLSETEILEITGIAPLYWSQLSNGMIGHLTTVNGLVSFSNSMILNAAKKRYTADSEKQKPYRARIAEYMEKQTSYRRKCDELPYQLFEMEEWDRLYKFLLDYNVFMHVYSKDPYEIKQYLNTLKKINSKQYTIKKYLELESSNIGEIDLMYTYGHISEFMCDFMSDYSLGLEFALKMITTPKKCKLSAKRCA